MKSPSHVILTQFMPNRDDVWEKLHSLVRIRQTDVGLMPSPQECQWWDFLGLFTAESRMASMLAWLLVTVAGLPLLPLFWLCIVHCALVL